ncbi:hypothetical protein R5R35_010013 [Gryllus longicercus]|uniref:Glutaredoxin-2, mitochondrial n=1 Tax=Gryllus longicercus TaxID=2509291 RepID=A0AAN9VWV3_9ORTH
MGLGASRAVNMSGTQAQLVKELISGDNVVIFSKTYCPYCTMAKEVFNKINVTYSAIELDKRDDADAIQDILGEITGARTVPRVFVKGQCIGGGTDVKKMYEAGKLEVLLQ